MTRVESSSETSCSFGMLQTVSNVATSDCRSVHVWALFMWRLCCEDSGLLGCYDWSIVPTLRRNVAPQSSGSSNLTLYLNCLPLKIAALRFFETSVRAPALPLVTVPVTGHCTPLVDASQMNPVVTSTLNKHQVQRSKQKWYCHCACAWVYGGVEV